MTKIDIEALRADVALWKKAGKMMPVPVAEMEAALDALSDVTRERDEARESVRVLTGGAFIVEGYDEVVAERDAALARAERAERERDEAAGLLKKCLPLVQHETTRCVNSVPLGNCGPCRFASSCERRSLRIAVEDAVLRAAGERGKGTDGCER